jgi:hypothetical protein
MHKIYTLIICLTLVFLPSCAKAQYTDTLECGDITSVIQRENLSFEDYSAYSSEDIAFIVDDDDKFDSCSVIHSSSSDDIGEIGVFHATSQENSLELVDDVTEYLYDLKEEKGDFVRNYLQEEQKKLDGATVKRFGNYVVFTVLEPALSNSVFKTIEKTLK